jgi:hypothetical protein
MAGTLAFGLPVGREIESGSKVRASYVWSEKVAYEAEDFHRVVACTGSVASLCKAADGDGPYTSTVVP